MISAILLTSLTYRVSAVPMTDSSYRLGVGITVGACGMFLLLAHRALHRESDLSWLWIACFLLTLITAVLAHGIWRGGIS